MVGGVSKTTQNVEMVWTYRVVVPVWLGSISRCACFRQENFFCDFWNIPHDVYSASSNVFQAVGSAWKTDSSWRVCSTHSNFLITLYEPSVWPPHNKTRLWVTNWIESVHELQATLLMQSRDSFLLFTYMFTCGVFSYEICLTIYM